MRTCWFKQSIDFVCSPFYPNIEHWFIIFFLMFSSLTAYLYWIFNGFVEYCTYQLCKILVIWHDGHWRHSKKKKRSCMVVCLDSRTEKQKWIDRYLKMYECLHFVPRLKKAFVLKWCLMLLTTLTLACSGWRFLIIIIRNWELNVILICTPHHNLNCLKLLKFQKDKEVEYRRVRSLI